MASLMGRVTQWARSPQGQRVIAEAAKKAQQVAKDPATRARVQQMRSRVANRHSPSTPGETSTDTPERRA